MIYLKNEARTSDHDWRNPLRHVIKGLRMEKSKKKKQQKTNSYPCE